MDAVNRDTAVVASLLPTGTTKRFDYAYNAVNDITAVQRDSANGDGFSYDLTQQIIGFQRDGTNVNLSAGTVTGGTANAMEFDGTGNRTKLNGTSSSYNNMNQPTDAGITYDTNGNLKTWNGWVYTYDAQNRLRSAVNTSASPQLGASTNIMVQFYYDGLNRQVARSMTNVVLPPPPYPPPLIREAPTRASGPTFDAVFSVWDGDWAILEEYGPSNVLTQSYLQGYHGLVKTLQTNIYYYQDELGSTSHIASATGALLEYYKYDLYGKPTFFSSTSQPLNSSAYGVKDLFTGQRWVPELGLYDDRNRFMSPDLGRFLQPDPIGFKGDSSNLYRYCGNDWANKTDPMGLFGDQQADRANMQREQHDQHMDGSQQIEAMELRNTAYAPTAGKVERQTQQQAAFAAQVQREIADGPRYAQAGGPPPERQGVAISYNKEAPPMQPNTERYVRSVADNAGVQSINISATTNGQHAPNSNHYKGTAVDINQINGERVINTGTDRSVAANVRAFQRSANNSQIGVAHENYGPAGLYKNGMQFTNPKLQAQHENHIHITIPNNYGE